jgi:hypothetical protein
MSQGSCLGGLLACLLALPTVGILIVPQTHWKIYLSGTLNFLTSFFINTGLNFVTDYSFPVLFICFSCHSMLTVHVTDTD